MCTGILHTYRCQQCNSVIYRVRDATPGHTCRAARQNGQRGTCRTGVEYSRYDRWDSDEYCLLCEMELAREMVGITAETCDEGGEPWPEDDVYDDVGADDKEGGVEDPFSDSAECEDASDKEENEGKENADEGEERERQRQKQERLRALERSYCQFLVDHLDALDTQYGSLLAETTTLDTALANWNILFCSSGDTDSDSGSDTDSEDEGVSLRDEDTDTNTSAASSSSRPASAHECDIENEDEGKDEEDGGVKVC